MDMNRVLLVRMGEIFLKGDNRAYFISALAKRIRYAVRPLGGTVEVAQGRIFVRGDDINAFIPKVCKVFGVHSVSPAMEVEKTLPAIESATAELAKGLQGSFKVSARRADKRFPLDSMQLNAHLGGVALEANPALTVDVHHPQTILSVEIREHAAFLHAQSIPAVGGMPSGTSGRAMLLLSGGIDSPVAGYRMMKRGVELYAIHYHSFPFTSEQAKEKVVELARLLAGYGGHVRLFVVPFTKIQQELYDKCPDNQLTILMRRFMMRIADRVAVREGCGALITGESLGQVASQTMDGLLCSNAVCTLPVYRPLIGFDKTEIMDEARAIGTYETSILPYEDCCTIFTPRHPLTKPKVDKLVESEALLEVEALCDEAVAGIEEILCRVGDVEA